MAEKKVDPKTGETWQKVDPLYKKPAFGWGIVALCCVLGGVLWFLAKPQSSLSTEGLHYFHVAKALVTGHGYSVPVGDGSHWIPEASASPFYPFLLAGVMLIVSPGNPEAALPYLHYLNLIIYFASIVSVYWLARLYFRPPLNTIITLVYTVAPITLIAAMDLSPLPLFTLFSLRAIRLLDKAFSKAGEGKLPNHQALVHSAISIFLAAATHPLGLALVPVFLWFVVRWLGWFKFFNWAVISALLLVPALGYRLYVSHFSGGPNPTERTPVWQRPVPQPKTVALNSGQAVVMLSMATLGDPIMAPDVAVPPSTEAQPETVSFKGTNQSWFRAVPLLEEVAAVVVSGLILIGGLILIFQASGTLGLYGLVATVGLALLTGFTSLKPVVYLFPAALFAVFRTFQWLLGQPGKGRLPGANGLLLLFSGLIIGTSIWDYIAHSSNHSSNPRWYQIASGEPQAVQNLFGWPAPEQVEPASTAEPYPASAVPAKPEPLNEGKVEETKVGVTQPLPTAAMATATTDPQPSPASPGKETLWDKTKNAVGKALGPAQTEPVVETIEDMSALNTPMNEAADWLAANTAPKSRITTPLPQQMALASGRRTESYPVKAPESVMMTRLANTPYVVDYRNSQLHQQVIAPLQQAYPGRFKLQFTSSDRQVQIWRVLPADSVATKPSAPQLEPASAL